MGRCQNLIKINEMSDFHCSNRPKALKIFRYVSLLLMVTNFTYLSVGSNPTLLVYFTNWGLMTTTTYFLFASLSYFINFPFKAVAYVFFEIIWAMNICITLLFWLYLYPLIYDKINLFDSILAHFVPIVFTLLDFFQNQIIFIRSHYIFPALEVGCYSVLFISYTLKVNTIYQGITFKNYISFIIVFIMFLLLFGSLELGRHLTKKRNEKDMKKSVEIGSTQGLIDF